MNRSILDFILAMALGVGGVAACTRTSNSRGSTASSDGSGGSAGAADSSASGFGGSSGSAGADTTDAGASATTTAGGATTMAGATSSNAGTDTSSGGSSSGGSAGAPGATTTAAGGTSTSTSSGNDSCDGTPCANGGVCEDSLDGYSCDCTGTGFEGPTCEMAVNPCDALTCENAGTCVAESGNARCECSGWAGTRCEIPIIVALGNPPGAASCQALGISGDATTAVGVCTKTDGSAVSVATKWNAAGTPTALAAASGSATARAASATGFYIVGKTGTSTGSGVSAAGWTSAAAPRVFYSAEIADGNDGWGVSGDGIIVVGQAWFADYPYTRAVYWDTTADDIVYGPTPIWDGDMDGWAYAASHDGSVIVGEGASVGFSDAIRWTAAGGGTRLPQLASATNAAAYAVTSDGSLAVGYSGGQAVSWLAADAPQALGIPGKAYAVSADAGVIVGSAGSGAFVWDSVDSARYLADVLTAVGADLTGWSLTQARGISADAGVIVGFGELDGVATAWRINLTNTGLLGL